MRKTVAGLVLGAGVASAWMVGGALVRDVQFAHAEQAVQASREQLASVQDIATVYKAVGKAVEPSVVSIHVTKTVRMTSMNRFRDQLRPFLRDRNGDGEQDAPDGGDIPDMPEQFQQEGTGSGVIMDVDGSTGYIVTNNHVASGASEMVVTLSDGREVKNAKVVGTDPKSDLAVLRIQADHLIPARWGDSDSLEKGDIVLAFGSPFGYVGSMTHGIVSGLSRQAQVNTNRFAYENFIQVDAQINPGNSGGPLVNLKGDVVGINSAIATDTGHFQGLGFAIPAAQAKPVYDAIKTKGKVTRGWLGVEIQDVAKAPEEAAAEGYTDHNGVLVKGMMRNTPATGKLQAGDVITSLNGKKIETMTQLRNAIAATEPGADVKLTVFRNHKTQDVSIKLGEQPDDLRMASAQEDENGTTANSDHKVSAETLGLGVTSPTSNLRQRYGLDDNVDGALVNRVRTGSQAFMAGVRPGDVITKVDDTPVNSPDDLNDALASKDLSKGVKLYWTNRESTRYAFIKLATPEK